MSFIQTDTVSDTVSDALRDCTFFQEHNRCVQTLMGVLTPLWTDNHVGAAKAAVQAPAHRYGSRRVHPFYQHL